MRYATAIWNYAEEGVEFGELIEEFAGFGHDTISFSSSQWTKWSNGVGAEVASVIERHGLGVTAHCSFDVTPADAERLLGWFGEALLTVTFDAQMLMESRGMLYDAAGMAATLSGILDISAGTELKIAVEDFPLDRAALDFYRDDLAPVLDHPWYGILVDVGHLNMRVRQEGYFEGQSPEEYIAAVPLPIVEVHIHDNNGAKDEHGHIGLGNCDFAAVAAALKQVGFQGVSTIEIAPSFHGSTPAESKPDAKASLETWKALWEG